MLLHSPQITNNIGKPSEVLTAEAIRAYYKTTSPRLQIITTTHKSYCTLLWYWTACLSSKDTLFLNEVNWLSLTKFLFRKVNMDLDHCNWLWYGWNSCVVITFMFELYNISVSIIVRNGSSGIKRLNSSVAVPKTSNSGTNSI